MFEDQFQLVRYDNSKSINIIPGHSVRVISTDQGEIPVLVVPGNSIGRYVAADTFT